MKGAFLVNKKGKLALAQLGDQVKIAAIRYHRSCGMCVVVTANGEEETFENVIATEIAAAMHLNAELLVMHTDETTQKCISDYYVPMTVLD